MQLCPMPYVSLFCETGNSRLIEFMHVLVMFMIKEWKKSKLKALEECVKHKMLYVGFPRISGMKSK